MLIEDHELLRLSQDSGKNVAWCMQNAGAEPAMEWVLSHMGDEDFNDPLPEASSTGTAAAPAADPEQLIMLTSMGFTDAQAAAALKVGACLM